MAGRIPVEHLVITPVGEVFILARLDGRDSTSDAESAPREDASKLLADYNKAKKRRAKHPLNDGATPKRSVPPPKDDASPKKRSSVPPTPLSLAKLPEKLVNAILAWAADPDADCKHIEQLRATNKAFAQWCRDGCDEAFWRWACEIYEWDREDRRWTMDSMKPTPWQTQYHKWCSLQLTETTLRAAKHSVVTRDPSGAEPHQYYGPIECWDTSRVTDMSQMFVDAYAFNKDIGRWNTSRVTDMSRMFDGAYAFNKDIGRWNTSRVTDMSRMFDGAYAFNKDIGRWNTSRVTDMSRMFDGAKAFNKAMWNWDVKQVTDMSEMFALATAFNQYIGGWDVFLGADSMETNTEGMFLGADSMDPAHMPHPDDGVVESESESESDLF